VIVAALVALALVALIPLVWTYIRGADGRGRREAAMALHRAQLGEIDRDLAQQRISIEDHATAKLEIQRRLLAAAEDVEPPAGPGGRWVLTATLLVVPVGAAGLYMIGGRPDLPAAPLAARIAAARAEAQDQTQLIDELRKRLAQLDPRSDQARQGYVLLGNAEETRGNLESALVAWRTALSIRFDATLAAETAEAQTVLDGRVTPESAALFRQALAAASPDVPWRGLAEKRLTEVQ
jgi:cytochrome c-type biogenesis protein CcmH